MTPTTALLLRSGGVAHPYGACDSPRKVLQCTCPSKTQDPVQSPHEGETMHAGAHALTVVFCFVLFVT